MAVMTTERKGPGRPRNKVPTKPVQIRPPLSWVDALDALARRNRRTRNQEMLIALELYLRSEDHLPDDRDEDSDE